MVWYGLPITGEGVARIIVTTCVFWAYIRFARPENNSFRLKARYRIFRRADPLVRFGVYASGAFFVITLIIYGLPSCDGGADCHSKLFVFLRSDPNELGDALAGLFSALAFLWIIVTVLLQSKELREQRCELKDQREATQKLAENSSAQVVESFVFEAMNSYSQLVGDMDIRNNSVGIDLYRGRDCFVFFYKKIREIPPEEARYGGDSTIKRYDTVYREHSSDLSHYFRFVYNIFRSLDEMPGVKPRHMRMIRSLFSDYELLVIFYNCATERGAEMRKYALKYRVFHNMPLDDLVYPSHKAWLFNDFAEPTP